MSRTLLIPDHVFAATTRFLKRRGTARMEGLVLWAGRSDDQSDSVLTIIKAGDDWPHGVRLEFNQMLKLTEFLAAHSLTLLAQVHNHPDRIPHSQGDNDNPASHRPGYLSLVVPEMGIHGIRLGECYAYEYVGRLEWRELDVNERVDRLRVLPKGLRL